MQKRERTAAEILATVTFQQPSESSAPVLPLTPTKAQMERLWTRLAGLFGNSFTRQYGEQPSEEWTAALAGFTGDDLARGLKAVIKLGDTFPPNAVQFRNLSIEFHAPAHRPFPPADRLIESDELRQARKTKMREMRALWKSKGLLP
jgi:hypothetical protein